MEINKITEIIIGCAIEVHKQLGPGLKIPDETEPPFRSKLNHLLTGGFVIQI